MSMNELLTNDVKTWSNLYVTSINFNNTGVTGLTGSNTPLDTYYNNTYSLGSSGATGGATLSVNVTRTGNIVSLSWGDLTFTGGVTGTLNFILPSGYMPIVDYTTPIITSISSANTIGYIQSSGLTISFAGNYTTGVFPTGVSCLIFAGGKTYIAS